MPFTEAEADSPVTRNVARRNALKEGDGEEGRRGGANRASDSIGLIR